MADLQQLILAGADERDLSKLAEYQAIGGYGALEKARGMTREKVIEEISTATLRGRGGAGFPMGRKLSLVQPPEVAGKPTYVVANADESEPGSFKDREILRRVPHRFLEGCLIAAHAIGSAHVLVYIRGEYAAEYEVLKTAADEVRDAGLLGDVTLVLHRGAGAYICGEETALLDSLEGKRGQPRPRPPFPPISGLYGSPTLINNVQTIANVPIIIEHGARWYVSIGPEASPGTVVFSLSGNVERPGNYELPLGTTLRELIYDVGGGVAGGTAAEGGHPRRLVRPRVHAGRDRHSGRLRLDPGRRLVPRLGGDHRHRRPGVHGAARAARREVLHARVVRQVHAVPRGDALDGEPAREDRDGPRRALRPRSFARHLRPRRRSLVVRTR